MLPILTIFTGAAAVGGAIGFFTGKSVGPHHYQTAEVIAQSRLGYNVIACDIQRF